MSLSNFLRSLRKVGRRIKMASVWRVLRILPLPRSTQIHWRNVTLMNATLLKMLCHRWNIFIRQGLSHERNSFLTKWCGMEFWSPWRIIQMHGLWSLFSTCIMSIWIFNELENFMVYALQYVFQFWSITIIFTYLYNIFLSLEFISTRDSLFSEIVLKVLLDVFGDYSWPRVDTLPHPYVRT